MGIDGLWKMNQPTRQLYHLNDLTHMNGYSEQKKENILRVGVDISTLMNECVAADHASHVHQHRSNGALRTFFEKLCKLLRTAPVIAIFVFDGPLRPSFKRGKEINTYSIPEWKAPCEEIIEACGFYSHQAPGEAEAELAMLSERGVIDAVITSDSDTFLFGAQCVLRSIAKSDAYYLYSMDVIANSTDIIEWPPSTVVTVSPLFGSLSRGGLILMALLSKSDYSRGLSGCGPTIATSLARCGFGDDILCAFQQLTGTALDETLLAITYAIADELRSNSRGALGSRYPTLASDLLASNLLTAKAIGDFAAPIVSSAPIPAWIERNPNIPQIASFCRSNFHWGTSVLEKKIHNILWPGISLRLLISPLMVYDSTKRICHTPSTQAIILKVSTVRRKNKSGRWARITLSAGNFFSQLGQGVSVPSIQSKDSKILIWAPIEYIPEQLLEASTSTAASVPELSHQNDGMLTAQHPLEDAAAGASTSQLSPLDSSLLTLVDQIPVDPVSDPSEVLKKRRAAKRKANRLAKKRKDKAAAFEHALEQVAGISDDALDYNGATSSAPQKRKSSRNQGNPDLAL